jgi:hypothetical protein
MLCAMCYMLCTYVDNNRKNMSAFVMIALKFCLRKSYVYIYTCTYTILMENKNNSPTFGEMKTPSSNATF